MALKLKLEKICEDYQEIRWSVPQQFLPLEPELGKIVTTWKYRRILPKNWNLYAKYQTGAYYTPKQTGLTYL